MLLKENDAIRKLLRVDIWHRAGYTGKGIKGVILDSAKGKPRKGTEAYLIDVFGTAKESGHGSNAAQVAHEMAPDGLFYYLDNTRNKDAVFNWVRQHAHEISFINVSLAGLNGMSTDDYLRYESLNIPMFCASGNDGFTDHISYPARYSFAIAIGATNSKGTSVDSYSNKGPNLDGVATSHVSIRNSNGEVWAPSGTSFASPTVFGLFFLYEQRRRECGLPKITPAEVMQLIEEQAKDMYAVGRDDISGYGLIRLPEIIPTFQKGDDTMRIRPCPITFVDYHHTAGNETNAQQIREDHMSSPNNWGDIGYNSVIRKDGVIEKGRDPYYSGAHDPGLAPDGSGYTMNDCAYSIVCIGNFDTEQMSEVQYQGLLKEAKRVRDLYKINITRHRRHNEQYATECPGRYFPWNRLLNDLRSSESVKEESTVEKVVVIFSVRDMTAGLEVAAELGGVGVFDRNRATTAHKDVYAAKKVYTVGGGRLYPENDPREVYMSGLDAFGTMAAVAKAKADGKLK